MTKKGLKAVVIGGGVHGLTSSIALAREGIDVTLIEKNKELMQGTSGATHNRAHMGYHYPRSIETAVECLEGLNFFKRKYSEALFYPKDVYYLIEKNKSKTSVQGFIDFCTEMKIPYEMEDSSSFWNNDLIAAGFKVPEPVFKIKSLTNLLEKEASGLGVNIRKGSEVVGLEKNGSYKVVTREKGEKKNYKADIILNATYAYSNNVLKALGLEEDMTRYLLQRTEIIAVRSKKPVPSLTVLDGEFISVMQYGENPELYLVYDVIHSNVDKEEGYFLNHSKKYPTNLKKMIEHGAKYFMYMRELEYVESLYGSRPVPLKIAGDSRKTRIKSHKGAPGVYSILEGKFISAPLIAERLINQMKKDGVII